MPPRQHPLAVLVAAAGCILTGPCLAAELPEGLSAKSSLTEGDKAAVREFSRGALAALAGADAPASQQAREALLEPLRGEVSVAFRLDYSEALSPTLATAAKGADERIAFNALRVSGALATQASVDIIRGALADQRAPIRYGGAFAARRTLQEVASGRSPLDPAQVGALVESLTKALSVETDAGVAEGLVSSFEAVGERSRSGALASMCSAVAAQFNAFGTGDRAGAAEAWAHAFQRAVRAAQRALLDQGRVGALDPSLAKAAAEMCGRALAHAVARLEAPAPQEGSGDREAEVAALTELASDAEGTLIFIDANLAKRQPPPPQTIRAAFPDAARVRAEALKWLGAQGHLTKPPYDLKPMLR